MKDVKFAISKDDFPNFPLFSFVSEGLGISERRTKEFEPEGFAEGLRY